MRENEGKKVWRERLDEKGRKNAEIWGKIGWRRERMEGRKKEGKG